MGVVVQKILARRLHYGWRYRFGLAESRVELVDSV